MICGVSLPLGKLPRCAAFARFYFLSNDELLEILSQTKVHIPEHRNHSSCALRSAWQDPLRVQPFLSKVFEASLESKFACAAAAAFSVVEAMKKLTFTDQLVATQMHSKEGEIIDFAWGSSLCFLLGVDVPCSERVQVNPVVTKDKNVETWMTDRLSM